jgi:hypothetical protein
VFLGGVSVGFGSMHGAIGVFWRGVDRVQLEVYVSGVDNVVPHPGGNDDRPIVLDFIALVDRATRHAEIGACGALFQPEELVQVDMSLPADLSTGWNRHDGELAVHARVDDRPKVDVVLGDLFDVPDPAQHGAPFILP